MTENEVYERCIGHFKIVRRYADHVQCNCPAHSDKQASLTISKGRKCVLFHCHAGCTIESILLAVGIEKSDTFFESISNPVSPVTSYLQPPLVAPQQST